MLSSCEKASYFHAFVTSRALHAHGLHTLVVFVLASFGLWAFVSFLRVHGSKSSWAHGLCVFVGIHRLVVFVHSWAFMCLSSSWASQLCAFLLGLALLIIVMWGAQERKCIKVRIH